MVEPREYNYLEKWSDGSHQLDRVGPYLISLEITNALVCVLVYTTELLALLLDFYYYVLLLLLVLLFDRPEVIPGVDLHS